MTSVAATAGANFATYMDRARALVPLIQSEADEGERTRTVTDNVAAALRESRLPWMLVPAGLGGGGLSIAECVEITEVIAAADASTGWIFQAYTWAAGIQAGFLPPVGATELLGGAEPQILCGAFAPPGRATLVEGGGVKITGHWNFGSGARHADYIGGGVLVYDDAGNLRLNADGTADVRFAFMPKSEVSLRGNWDVSGLVGTDSQDYGVDGIVIPEDHVTSAAPSAEPFRPEGMYRMGLLNISVAGHASIALGLMRRLLHEVATLTEGKQRMGYPTPVDEYPAFLSDFTKHESAYQGARAYVLESFRAAQAYADREGSLSPELAGRVRAASTQAHTVAAEIADFSRLWSGTKGFREPSAVARAGRDVAVAVTHLQVDPITLVDAGPALLDAWKSI